MTVFSVAEFGVKIMWGKIKKVKRDSQCFKNSKNILSENCVKISFFRWGIAPNRPAVIPPLSILDHGRNEGFIIAVNRKKVFAENHVSRKFSRKTFREKFFV
jgi:hypothetical protein